MTKLFTHQIAHNLLVKKHYNFQNDSYKTILENEKVKIISYIDNDVDVKILDDETNIYIEDHNKISEIPLVFDFQTYLILIADIGSEFVQIFYCDHDIDKIGVVWFDEDAGSVNAEFVVGNDDNYILPRTHIQTGFGWYPQSYEDLNKFYEEEMVKYKKSSDNEEYCGKCHFGMTTQEKLIEMSKKGAPLVRLSPNCDCPPSNGFVGKTECADIMWQLIFVPSANTPIN